MGIVVIDLSFLRECSANYLANSLGDFRALVTFELVYEIMTNSDNRPFHEDLDKLVKLNCLQSRSLIGLVNREIDEGRAMNIDDVLDNDGTSKLADFIRNGQGTTIGAEVESDVRRFFECDEPRRLREGLDRMWDSRFDDIFAQAPKNGDIECTAHYYKTAIWQKMEAEIGQVMACEHGMNQPPASGWLIYEWQRLRNFLTFRFRLNGTRSEQLKDKKLANDLLDLHYLAFLSHVDGIATHDTKVIVPLAKVFFPSCLLVL